MEAISVVSACANAVSVIQLIGITWCRGCLWEGYSPWTVSRDRKEKGRGVPIFF